MSYELILGTFHDGAESVDLLLKRYHDAQDQLGIQEAVAIIRPLEGQDEIRLMGDHKKKARKIGAISGAVLGIIGGPAGMIVMGAAGAAVGNFITSLSHAGISKEMIEKIEQGLEPGSSAVVVIVEAEHHQLILKDLKEVGAVTVNESIESPKLENPIIISPSGGKASSQ